MDQFSMLRFKCMVLKCLDMTETSVSRVAPTVIMMFVQVVVL